MMMKPCITIYLFLDIKSVAVVAVQDEEQKMALLKHRICIDNKINATLENDNKLRINVEGEFMNREIIKLSISMP